MNDIKDIFFDLDHTLWDFDKNSDLTFFKILEKNNIKIDVNKFLNEYSIVQKKHYKLISGQFMKRLNSLPIPLYPHIYS